MAPTHHRPQAADLADAALRRRQPSRQDLLSVLDWPDEHLLDLVAAVGRVRRRFFADRVKLNYLVNLKSGLCPEDCTYCSQRLGSQADIVTYTWLSPDQARRAAACGADAGATRICQVASGRGPTDRDLARLAPAVAAIKSDHPHVEVCACLGLLSPGQARQLADCGVDAYNHNLNTSGERYADICTTHGFTDRVQTVRRAAQAGLSPCSGLIAGMGETDADLADALLDLHGLAPDSVPVNFLIPFDGTPLAGRWELTPQRCLRILAAARLVFPDAEVRLAGGREIHLRSLQPLALHLANSIFLGDYLTSEGQPGSADLAMLRDAGFRPQGAADPAPPARPTELVRTRRRGPGTDLPPNT